jgi:hypothetical protein
MNYRKYFFIVTFVVVVAVIIGNLWVYIGGSHNVSIENSVSLSNRPTGSIVVTVAGDYGANFHTDRTLDGIRQVAPDFALTTGDLGYTDKPTEQEWCDYVKSHVGDIPFEIIAGNHEGDGMPLHINNFIKCLPNKLPGVVGEYGKQYYVDYSAESASSTKPATARFIMISPEIKIDGETYSYKPGTERFKWLKSAVDDARAQKVRWVIAVMHKDCITPGLYACSIGPELMNYLTGSVDLVVHSHNHAYGRTKQLKCVVAGQRGVVYTTDCAVENKLSNVYEKGAGAVALVVGTAGRPLRNIDYSDSIVNYYETTMGLNRTPMFGFVRLTITDKELRGDFIGVEGEGFSDTFVIRQ